MPVEASQKFMGTNLFSHYGQNEYEFSKQIYACGNCPGGRMRRKFSTYFLWLADELIAVPDFPVMQCDVCKHCEYDMHASRYLKTVFGAETPRDKQNILYINRNLRIS